MALTRIQAQLRAAIARSFTGRQYAIDVEKFDDRSCLEMLRLLRDMDECLGEARRAAQLRGAALLNTLKGIK